MNRFQIMRHILTPLFVSLAFAAAGQAQPAATPQRDSVKAQQAPARLSNTHTGKKAERQELMTFLKSLNIPEEVYNEPEGRQWQHLAGVFTHLRLYPLAMKCFLKTLSPDSLVNDDIPFTNSDKVAVENQLKNIGYEARPVDCNIIRVDSILQLFNDGKKARAYAMIFHVKQPERGKPIVHKFIYTGHTFITLIKYNTDSTYTAISFGFGPNKDNLLAATPIMPASTSKFTDDSGHQWDEVVGKFVSKRRFERILQLTRQYESMAYHLSKNNCTDFGLRAAQIAGLEVRDTQGSWPLGSGNNPGVTGESILLGKFKNSDTGNQNRLFVDTTLQTQTAKPVH